MTWGTCYSGSNNIHFDFPPIMTDGRNYATWQPGAVINQQIKKQANIKSNWQYRKYLTDNADSIIKYNQLEACDQCCSCPARYGNQKSSTKTIERSVKQETSETLDDLMEWSVNKKWEGRLEVFYYAGQSNALIKDDKCAIIGGLNWLSDNGSLNPDELSWIISNRDFIIQERDKIVMGHQE